MLHSVLPVPVPRFLRVLLLSTTLPCGVLWAASPTANVVVYDKDYREDERARVVTSRLVAGYTTSFGPYDGNTLDVSRLDPQPFGGFIPLGSVNIELSLPGDPMDYFIYTNQNNPIEAVSYFGEPGIFDPFSVEVDPPGGNFQVPQRVTFFAPNDGTIITYSINGGSDNQWEGETILLASDSTISYRGKLENTFGPIKHATYLIDVPLCQDSDFDTLPDGIEISLGLDPQSAQADFNGNTLDDFDEFLRGTNAFLPNTPNSLPPGWVDADGDSWSEFDETLRGTLDADPTDHPAAPNLQTVELLRTGTIEEAAIGGTGVPLAPQPVKPWPAKFEVDVLDPTGTPLAPSIPTNANAYIYRTSGEQFHLIRAKTFDQSGRVLLAVEPPVGLCIDLQALCASATTPAAWRAAYLAQYNAAIFNTSANNRIDPRTTVEAFLLNRYYEIEGESTFIPGVENAGPEQSLVQSLRTARNESELFALIQAGVTPAMIDLVSDYLRFYTSPGNRPMLALLADHMAGRAVAPEDIPAGVRQQNIAIAAGETAAFFASLPPARTILTGPLALDEFGFTLTQDATTYRLQSYIDAWPEGTVVTVETIINREGCGLTPVPAVVTNVLGIELPALPEEFSGDGDQLGDDWEYFYFGNLDEGDEGDADNDGVSNLDEFNDGTNPNQQSQQQLPQSAWFFF